MDIRAAQALLRNGTVPMAVANEAVTAAGYEPLTTVIDPGDRFKSTPLGKQRKRRERVDKAKNMLATLVPGKSQKTIRRTSDIPAILAAPPQAERLAPDEPARQPLREATRRLPALPLEVRLNVLAQTPPEHQHKVLQVWPELSTATEAIPGFAWQMRSGTAPAGQVAEQLLPLLHEGLSFTPSQPPGLAMFAHGQWTEKHDRLVDVAHGLSAAIAQAERNGGTANAQDVAALGTLRRKVEETKDPSARALLLVAMIRAMREEGVAERHSEAFHEALAEVPDSDMKVRARTLAQLCVQNNSARLQAMRDITNQQGAWATEGTLKHAASLAIAAATPALKPGERGTLVLRALDYVSNMPVAQRTADQAAHFIRSCGQAMSGMTTSSGQTPIWLQNALDRFVALALNYPSNPNLVEAVLALRHASPETGEHVLSRAAQMATVIPEEASAQAALAAVASATTNLSPEERGRLVLQAAQNLLDLPLNRRSADQVASAIQSFGQAMAGRMTYREPETQLDRAVPHLQDIVATLVDVAEEYRPSPDLVNAVLALRHASPQTGKYVMERATLLADKVVAEAPRRAALVALEAADPSWTSAGRGALLLQASADVLKMSTEHCSAADAITFIRAIGQTISDCMAHEERALSGRPDLPRLPEILNNLLSLAKEHEPSMDLVTAVLAMRHVSPNTHGQIINSARQLAHGISDEELKPQAVAAVAHAT